MSAPMSMEWTPITNCSYSTYDLTLMRYEGFVEEVWKENSLWYGVVARSKASVVGKSSSGNGFVPCGGFCVSTEIGPFVNFPG